MDDPSKAAPNDRRGSQRVKKCKQKYAARARGAHAGGACAGSLTSLNFTDDGTPI